MMFTAGFQRRIDEEEITDSSRVWDSKFLMNNQTKLRKNHIGSVFIALDDIGYLPVSVSVV